MTPPKKPGSWRTAVTPRDYYDMHYKNFATKLYREVRLEQFGEDIGQGSWLTADEQDVFIAWLKLGANSRLLDVACGSGGPTLRIAEKIGCHVLGVDIEEQGVENAISHSITRGLAERAQFQRLDASESLPFDAGSFDAIICIDAINHLPNREAVLADWARLLKPGGRLVYTDPIVITGPLSFEEIAIRSSIGFYLFMPPGENERLLETVGLKLLKQEERTTADILRRWSLAREARVEALRRLEGDATYDDFQRFLQVSAQLAQERRLSRFAFLAAKPA